MAGGDTRLIRRCIGIMPRRDTQQSCRRNREAGGGGKCFVLSFSSLFLLCEYVALAKGSDLLLSFQTGFYNICSVYGILTAIYTSVLKRRGG
jgi:hypothetical protein